MTLLFISFWSVMIFTSIFWYGFLLFYVGAKGGKEIKEMTRTLQRRADDERKN
jgi:hypothetical protein